MLPAKVSTLAGMQSARAEIILWVDDPQVGNLTLYLYEQYHSIRCGSTFAIAQLIVGNVFANLLTDS